MASYLVTFIEGMPSQGPSEVEHAEVLNSGWVRVVWRDERDLVRFYPPHVVLSVQTPTEEQEAQLEAEKVANDISEYISARLKRLTAALAVLRRGEEPEGSSEPVGVDLGGEEVGVDEDETTPPTA